MEAKDPKDSFVCRLPEECLVISKDGVRTYTEWKKYMRGEPSELHCIQDYEEEGWRVQVEEAMRFISINEHKAVELPPPFSTLGPAQMRRESDGRIAIVLVDSPYPSSLPNGVVFYVAENVEENKRLLLEALSQLSRTREAYPDHLIKHSSISMHPDYQTCGECVKGAAYGA